MCGFAVGDRDVRKGPERTRRLYRRADAWLYRVKVTEEHLRGSGSPAPMAIATILGLQHGQTRQLNSALGPQTISWTGNQPAFGTIRRFLVAGDVETGSEIFLVIGDDGSFRTEPVDAGGTDALDRALRLVGATSTAVRQQPRAALATAIGLRADSPAASVIGGYRERGDSDIAELLLSCPGPAGRRACRPSGDSVCGHRRDTGSSVIGGKDAPALRSLNIAARYRSDREDVVADFYVPALSAAVSYSRAVGYFTSTSLALFARGLRDFADRGGTMRLIASPHLNADDITDIERGYDVRQVIERATLRELEAEDRDAILDGLGLVGRLIAEQRLDIKLAFVVQQGRVGIYHEKVGIFRDGVGDLVAFTGSANETLGGLLANFESVEVYLGWLPGDGTRALRIEEDFEDLWNDRTAILRVEPFPDVARERLIEIASGRPRAELPGRDDALEPPCTVGGERAARLAIPPDVTVRDYQRKAVEAWLGQRGRGILKMATGTGKTKTAMFAACQLAQALGSREQPLVLLIIAPLQHLVDQWITEVEAFGVRPTAVYESSQRWLPVVEDQLAEARLGQRPVVAMVATNASFAGDRFQAVLSRITQPLLVIADEAHNLGSSAYRSSSPAECDLPARAVGDAGTLVRRRGHRRPDWLLRPGCFRARPGPGHRDGRSVPVPLPAAPGRAG